jgi:hypothetical protein
MRMIDRVTVKGSVEPLDLYTCDVEFNNLALEPFQPRLNRKDAKLKRVKMRIARDRYRQLVFDGQLHVSSKFETDKDLVEMRKPFPQVSIFHVLILTVYRNSLKCSSKGSINTLRVTGESPRGSSNE